MDYDANFNGNRGDFASIGSVVTNCKKGLSYYLHKMLINISMKHKLLSQHVCYYRVLLEFQLAILFIYIGHDPFHEIPGLIWQQI
jgi:hypothetical protein